MNIRFIFRIAAIILMVFTLSACKSSEERAEEHFQSGIALFEQGDLDRAVVEFQNVFELNPTHEEARRKLAEIFYESGQLRRAYGQYLRLVEQVPAQPRQLRDQDRQQRRGHRLPQPVLRDEQRTQRQEHGDRHADHQQVHRQRRLVDQGAADRDAEQTA